MAKDNISVEEWKKIKETLKEDGWEEIDPGYYRSHREIRQYKNIYILHKTVKSDENTDCGEDKNVTHMGLRNNEGMEKPTPALEKVRGQIKTYGPKENYLTPDLSAITSWSDIPSIAALRDVCSDSLVIGYDSEWQEVHDKRFILSWQFACRWNGVLYLFLVFDTCSEPDKRLRLSHMLAVIFNKLNIDALCDLRSVYGYKCLECSKIGDGVPVENIYDTEAEALKHAVYEYAEDGTALTSKISDDTQKNRKVQRAIRDDVWAAKKFSVVVACHWGMADITSLEYDECKRILRNSCEVQNGIVTMMPMRFVCKSVYDVDSTPSAYLVSLTIADTLCHTAASTKSLKALGNACGVPKIEVDDKSRMMDLLKEHTKLFADYAVNDAVICVDYLKAVYGNNKNPPVTITSGGAKIVKSKMMNYLDVDKKSFDAVYRGTRIVKDGADLVDNDKAIGRAVFLENTRLYPLNPDVARIHDYASNAFNGGYNYCSIVGYYPIQTFDYDLCSAYPSAMGLIPDVDWVNPIKDEKRAAMGNLLSIDLSPWETMNSIACVYEPHRLIFADVREFEFPSNVLYPTIGVRNNGITVYPRSYSDHSQALRVAGPELYLALRLGASVKVKELIVLNPLRREDGTISHSMGYITKQLITDRNMAKKMLGKGSLPEQVLKTISNSIYGKIAQNVLGKNKYNARIDDMEALGGSPITNPVSACYITCLIRCVMLAAQNQLHDLGYKVYSVTTDGFISNAPEEVVQGLDLYGLKNAFVFSADNLLGNDPNRKIWEIKHKQNDLLNFTTRGNVSLSSDGVCAHAGAKSPYEKDSYEDRVWLFHGVISREGGIPYSYKEFVKFKDLVRGKVRDFTYYDKKKPVSVDFDCKRKPVRDSFETVAVTSPHDGNSYDLANFETEPYETMTEYHQYRHAASVCKVLRTETDWDRFYKALGDIQNGSGVQRVRRPRKSLEGVKDPEWAMVWACVVKHRQCGDEYKISYVSELENQRGSVNKIVEFFNKFNHGDHKMTAANWKDARKPDRLKNVLPDELTKDLRYKMQNYQFS